MRVHLGHNALAFVRSTFLSRQRKPETAITKGYLHQDIHPPTTHGVRNSCDKDFQTSWSPANDCMVGRQDKTDLTVTCQNSPLST